MLLLGTRGGKCGLGQGFELGSVRMRQEREENEGGTTPLIPPHGGTPHNTTPHRR